MTPPSMRLYGPDERGPDGYPPEWHATIKHAVREAAGHRCVRCLHPYRQGEHGRGEWSPCDERCVHDGPLGIFVTDTPAVVHDLLSAGFVAADVVRQQAPHARVQARWRILTVHHLDGDKGNCRWWNLAALCQRCHLTIQGKVQMARVWPWEHSEWFRPYVAGYYAQVYLGEELRREQVEARLDELLTLERAGTLGA